MSYEAAVEAIENKIVEATNADWSSEMILQLAEARAWLLAPAQPHGSSSGG